MQQQHPIVSSCPARARTDSANDLRSVWLTVDAAVASCLTGTRAGRPSRRRQLPDLAPSPGSDPADFIRNTAATCTPAEHMLQGENERDETLRAGLALPWLFAAALAPRDKSAPRQRVGLPLTASWHTSLLLLFPVPLVHLVDRATRGLSLPPPGA